jgi:diguanylate cyclase (GGDEF)-like protein
MKKIGILLHTTSAVNKESFPFLDELYRQCRDYDMQLVLIPTGPLGTFVVNRNSSLLPIIENAHLDGLIIYISWKSEQIFLDLIGSRLTIPVVNLLRNYPSSLSVFSNFESGMYKMVTHLIREHGYKKIAYCLGVIESHPLLESRFDGYKRALKENGIPLDPNLVIKITGDVSTGSVVAGFKFQGQSIVSQMLDQRKFVPGKDIDAIVAFNDRLALEMLKELTERGISCPEHVALVGHDDYYESFLTSPPLTTVNQNWESLVGEALSLLKDKFSGGKRRCSEVDHTLIFRRSCGCEQGAETQELASIKRLNEFTKFNLRGDNFQNIVQRTFQMMVMKTSIKEGLEVFSSSLPYLKVDVCRIFIYKENRDVLFQIYSYEDMSFKIFNNGRKYRPEDILSTLSGSPEYHFIVEPMYLGDNPIGIILYSLRKDENPTPIGIKNTLSVFFHTKFLISNLEETLDELKITMKLSETDPLTQLPNMRSFKKNIVREWGKGIRNKQPLSLIMMDVDHFKLYNDNYGHPEGDRCLQRLGEIINEHVRLFLDFPARYGGEEFVILLTNTTAKEAYLVAERIRKRIIEQKIPHQQNGNEGIITCSIGVSSCIAEESSRYDSLIKEADTALYNAKESGRNRVHLSV